MQLVEAEQLTARMNFLIGCQQYEADGASENMDPSLSFVSLWEVR